MSQLFHRKIVILAAVGLMALSGCASIGPGKMISERTAYNASITESWKQQILLNIVKIRYVEPLFFVDVGDIVAAHSMETGANVGFSRSMFDLSGTGDSSKLDLGVSGRYTDRPTITYRPLTGTAFRQGVISPIPVRNLLLGLDSGISAKFLFTLSVRRINGLRNEAHLPGTHVQGDSSFQRMVEILSGLQILDAVHITSRAPGPDQESCLFLTLGGRRSSAEASGLIRELQDLLDLDPGRNEYAVMSGSLRQGRDVITLQTYSLMQILAAVAARVQVPQNDLDAGRAIPGALVSADKAILDIIAVQSSTDRPVDAFAAVQYRSHWFWIDDHSLETKRVFSFIMLAFTLLEDDRDHRSPQLTIPTQ